MERPKDGTKFSDQMIQMPNRDIQDAGIMQLMGGVFTTLLTMAAQHDEREYQEKLQAQKLAEMEKLHAYQLRIRELEIMARPQALPQTQPSNPYRGANTVSEVEAILLRQPPSPQREGLLKELAKYPESTPIASLPNQTSRLLLAGR